MRTMIWQSRKMSSWWASTLLRRQSASLTPNRFSRCSTRTVMELSLWSLSAMWICRSSRSASLLQTRVSSSTLLMQIRPACCRQQTSWLLALTWCLLLASFTWGSCGLTLIQTRILPSKFGSYGARRSSLALCSLLHWYQLMPVVQIAPMTHGLNKASPRLSPTVHLIRQRLSSKSLVGSKPLSVKCSPKACLGAMMCLLMTVMTLPSTTHPRTTHPSMTHPSMTHPLMTHPLPLL